MGTRKTILGSALAATLGLYAVSASAQLDDLLGEDGLVGGLLGEDGVVGGLLGEDGLVGSLLGEDGLVGSLLGEDGPLGGGSPLDDLPLSDLVP